MAFESGLACDATALSPSERSRHRELVALLAAHSHSASTTAEGCRIRFEGLHAVWPLACEWIGLESRCCPFLELSLIARPTENLLLVELRGPEGALDVLNAEIPALVATDGPLDLP